MKIKPVYMTSKGVFLDKEEALLKRNRAKVSDSRPGDPVEYEPVRQSVALVVSIDEIKKR